MKAIGMKLAVMALATCVAGSGGHCAAAEETNANEIETQLMLVFNTLDTDEDKFVSIREAVANVFLLELFYRLDKNQDKKLSFNEFLLLESEEFKSTPD